MKTIKKGIPYNEKEFERIINSRNQQQKPSSFLDAKNLNGPTIDVGITGEKNYSEFGDYHHHNDDNEHL